MKNTTIYPVLLSLFTLASVVKAQKADPLVGKKKFYEVGITIGGARVNTEYVYFNTPNGEFMFKKNNYQPSVDGTINWGWLFYASDSLVWHVKTGVNFTSRSALLASKNEPDLQMSTGYVQIPIQFGFRFPSNLNRAENKLFKASQLSVGLFAASPVMQKLDHKDNLDSKTQTLAFNYLKFGLISEIMLTAFNENCKGHNFGIKVQMDFPTIVKLSETENQLYPFYYSIGVSYILANQYE